MLVLLTDQGGHDLAKERELTGFGRQVWQFMASRGITKQSELSRRIIKHSRAAVSADMVRNYLRGRSAVPPTFPGQVVSALELNERERADLAMAYAFGQEQVSSEERKAS
jgi:hypothetical protein